MGITEFYMKKVNEEKDFLKTDKGPLSHVVSMESGKVLEKYGVFNDFAGDELNKINEEGTILHKYSDRILVLVTEKCISNCAYCFRQKKLNNGSININTLLDQLEAYLDINTYVQEVIISGGDFMVYKYEIIQDMLERIKRGRDISIRLHTRAIVFQPNLFTKKIVDLFVQYNVRLYFHIVHPYEICNLVKKKMMEISRVVRCYNQFPLLRGINDNADVIKLLIKNLDECRVNNVVIYVPDPLTFLGQYRIPIKKCIEIKHKLEETSPSWINSFRMVFDSPSGKVNIDRFIRKDTDKQICYFSHKNSIVEFPDFPEEIYQDSCKEILLWKETKKGY